MHHWSGASISAECAAAATVTMTTDGGTNIHASEWRAAGGKKPGPWRGTTSNRSQLSPGIQAARDGDVETMAQLLASKESWDPATARDTHGSSALMWAAGNGHLEACGWLVRRGGVDPSGTARKDGRTALHWAARNGHLLVCQWLVQTAGVDPAAGLPYH